MFSEGTTGSEVDNSLDVWWCVNDFDYVHDEAKPKIMSMINAY